MTISELIQELRAFNMEASISFQPSEQSDWEEGRIEIIAGEQPHWDGSESEVYIRLVGKDAVVGIDTGEE